MSEQIIDMGYYIRQTPSTMRANIDARVELTAPFVRAFLSKPFTRLVCVACGSSYNATECSRGFFEEMTGVEMKVVTPFTFAHYPQHLKETDLVVCISQSGRSTNTIEALDICRTMGIPTIGITGDVNSEFKDHADLVIDWGLNVETVGYVTKGLVTLTLFMDLCGLEVARATKRLNEAQYLDVCRELYATIDLHESMQNAFARHFEKHQEEYCNKMTQLFCVGCGSNMGTVLEGSLKVAETVHIPTNAYEVDEFIHGPNLQLTPDYFVVFVSGEDLASARVLKAYEATRCVTDHAFIVTTSSKVDDDHRICVSGLADDVRETLTPLYNVIFFQELAYEVSKIKGSMVQHIGLQAFKNTIASKTATFVDNDTYHE